MSFRRRLVFGLLCVSMLAVAGYRAIAALVGSASAPLDYLLGRKISVSEPQVNAIDQTSERMTFMLTNLSSEPWKVALIKCTGTCIKADAGTVIPPWTPTEVSVDLARSADDSGQETVTVFLDAKKEMFSVDVPVSHPSQRD
jgi:hypothetical protein